MVIVKNDNILKKAIRIFKKRAIRIFKKRAIRIFTFI